MKLILSDEKYRYDAESIASLFLPHERFGEDERDGEDYIRLTVDENGADATVSINGASTETHESDRASKLCAARALYRALSRLTGILPGWGILTGVRPAKLMRRLEEKHGVDVADRILTEDMLVLPSKIALCRTVAENEDNIIRMSADRDFSLYVSIPFCPTRCSYCSFVSHTVERAGGLIPEYLDKLAVELETVSDIVGDLGLNLKTVYIGGGTPAVLTAEQIDILMRKIGSCFDISGAAEYTVEAGRPDVITEEKLAAIKENGATRVSINPQTMDDRMLESVGRRHTAAQTAECFAWARKAGFCINMDLIAGLPGDSTAGFEHSMDAVAALDPENITVHTLALKRASSLDYKYGAAESAAVGKMVDYAYNKAIGLGCEPYYMYRQKRSPGNHENVGYAKPGCEGLYNVFMMDETHTILSVGASAVTKLVSRSGSNIQRIFNFKYPYEYISRFDEIRARKEKVKDFYGSDYEETADRPPSDKPSIN